MQFKRRAGVLLSALRTHLTGLATWSVPKSGMFVWVDVALPDGIADGSELLPDLLESKVCVVPGSIFASQKDGNGGAAARTSRFRMSFSQISCEDLVEGMRRLGVMLRSKAKAEAAAVGGDAEAGEADGEAKRAAA